MSSGVRGGGTLERTGAPLLGVAFILVLGTFMASLDATIVAVGIDTLVEEFDASVADIQWVTTAYLLAIVTVMPMSGWLADRFGGRRTWLTAVAVFLLGSVACAVAWSVPSLVVRSEEHTSELQSRENLVCRLLLEKKKCKQTKKRKSF